MLGARKLGLGSSGQVPSIHCPLPRSSSPIKPPVAMWLGGQWPPQPLGCGSSWPSQRSSLCLPKMGRQS